MTASGTTPLPLPAVRPPLSWCSMLTVRLLTRRRRVAVVPGARGVPVAVAPGLVAEPHVLVDVGGGRVAGAAAAVADAEVGRGLTSVGRGERGVGRAERADHAVMDERDERCRVAGRELG